MEKAFIQTPQENIVSYVTFYNGSETERKQASASLLTEVDFDDEGHLVRSDISYIETPFTELPPSLQEVLQKEFKTITKESIVIMRLFMQQENGDYMPIFLHEE